MVLYNGQTLLFNRALAHESIVRFLAAVSYGRFFSFFFFFLIYALRTGRSMTRAVYFESGVSPFFVVSRKLKFTLN